MRRGTHRKESALKIKLFELRGDEKQAYERAVAALPESYAIDAIPDILSADNIESVAGYEAVVINNKSILPAELITRMGELGVKLLSSRCIGYNHIDIDAAHRMGIHVCNTTYPPYGVAEFAVMLMLMSLRKCKPALWRQHVNDYSLEGLLGRELRTLTVGVMGTGRIGRAVIDNLSGFGCKILAYDPFPNAGLISRGISYVDVNALIEQSDLITVHMPLMDSTRNIIDAKAISKMRDGIVLINVSRGELMNTDALIDGIEREKIGALAMDVFEDEAGIYHENRMNDILVNRKMAYLRQFPNVLLTNHIAFYTDVDVDSMIEQGIANIVAMDRGVCATEL